ncbi:hypothetical protein GJV82_19150, partial [Cellulosimicrobium sp. BIT-GX5]|nr:hypothetical protein [Cellulosimicrobium composti]
MPRTAGAPGRAAETRSVGLQPVLAGAGAGLLAVAAVVFVFFTFADDLGLRALVTGVVTALTVGAAVLLRSRGLRSSAEAVAALAVVLAVVDVELVLQAWPLDAAGAALARAALVAVVVAVLGVVGARARVRAWLTSAVVLGPLVPLLAAPAAQAVWGWAVALLATACLTTPARPVAETAGARVGSALTAERAVLGVVRTTAVPLAVLVGLAVPGPPGLPAGSGAALVALGGALVATLLRHATRERRWYAIGGAAAVLAGALLGTGGEVAWIGLVPALAAAAWLALLAVTAPRGARASGASVVGRSDALLSGAVVALAAATPAVAVAGLRAVEVLVTATAGTPVVLRDAPLGVGVVAATGEGMTPGASGAVLLDGTLVGLLSGIVVLAVGARLALRTPRPVPLAAGTVPLAAGTVPPAAWTVPPAAGAVRLGAAPVVRTGRVLAPWLVLVLVLALVLDPRLAGVTSLALLAVLAGALVVATTRPVAASAHDPGATVRAVRRGAGRALRPLTRRVPG